MHSIGISSKFSNAKICCGVAKVVYIFLWRVLNLKSTFNTVLVLNLTLAEKDSSSAYKMYHNFPCTRDLSIS